MWNLSTKMLGKNTFKMKSKMDTFTRPLFCPKLHFYSLSMKILRGVI